MVSSTGCPFFALLFEDPSGCSRSQKNTILPSLYSLSLPPSLLPSLLPSLSPYLVPLKFQRGKIRPNIWIKSFQSLDRGSGGLDAVGRRVQDGHVVELHGGREGGRGGREGGREGDEGKCYKNMRRGE